MGNTSENHNTEQSELFRAGLLLGCSKQVERMREACVASVCSQHFTNFTTLYIFRVMETTKNLLRAKIKFHLTKIKKSLSATWCNFYISALGN
jgi:hypothetical protein